MTSDVTLPQDPTTLVYFHIKYFLADCFLSISLATLLTIDRPSTLTHDDPFDLAQEFILGCWPILHGCFGTHETIGVRDEHLITKQF